MTERERWIVYPLLFLALGAALRDKLFDLTTSKRIVCQELTVVDEEPTGPRPARVLARIGRPEGTAANAPPMGHLFVNGQVDVEGAVVARQFGTRGAPGILGILPPELWQALQQSAEALQKANAADPDASSDNAPPNESKSSESHSPEATQQ